jgi:hypothetical protein
MQDNVILTKTVVPSDKFKKVIDTSFSTFTPVEFERQELTLDEFFAEYERLFYDIPIEGSTHSHIYLITKSSEYVNYEKDTQDIQPLLDEIAGLREQLLEANTRFIQQQISSQ